MNAEAKRAKQSDPVAELLDAKGETAVAKNALLGISNRLDDVAQRIERTENLLSRVLVNPAPEWKFREQPDKDGIDALDDAAFAKLRASVAREQCAVNRMCAQAALAKTIHGGMVEKSQRLAKLDERIRSGACGSDAEIAVAKRRRDFVAAQLRVWADRFSAVTGDFASTRRKVVQKLVALTTSFDDMVPNGCNAYAVRFGCGENDIARPLELLSEMDVRMKAGPKTVKLSSITAFGERSVRK